MQDGLKIKIEELVLQCILPDELRLFELNINYHPGGAVSIQLLLDKEEGGITIDQCAFINRELAKAIDSHQVLNGNYMLEVSSPGTDRPLKTKKDFLRMRNRTIRCLLADPIDKKWEYQGIIQQVDEEHIVLSNVDREIAIPYQAIKKAVYVV